MDVYPTVAALAGLPPPPDVDGTLTEKSGKMFRLGIFLDFVGRTCGEPDEIELTAMGVKLNGSRCRHLAHESV